MTNRSPTGWKPADIAQILAAVEAGAMIGPVPTLLRRSDGIALLYPGKVHSLAGEPESGKSWIALAESARLIQRGANVLYLDYEDSPGSICARLLQLGVPNAAMIEHFVYVQPETEPTVEAIEELHTDRGFALAVIDGLSEAYQLGGLDSNANQDAATFLASLPRPLAARGAAVLQIDHVAKARESRGPWPIGAQHKIAGIDCAYSVERITAPSRASAGLLKLHVVKDRYGHVRAHTRGNEIALVRITPANDGEQVAVTIDPPDGSAEGRFRPTVIMERASRFVAEHPDSTISQIRDGVKGKSTGIDAALTLLIEEGYVERRQDGQAQRHTTRRDYQADTCEPATASPRPDRDPTPTGHAPQHRDPVSHPLTGGQGTGYEGTTPTASTPESLESAVQQRLDYADVATPVQRQAFSQGSPSGTHAATPTHEWNTLDLAEQDRIEQLRARHADLLDTAA